MRITAEYVCVRHSSTENKLANLMVSKSHAKQLSADITEIKAKDGKLYVSAIFDCYDLMPNGLAMADHDVV